jgi:YHS domain-containing protein
MQLTIADAERSSLRAGYSCPCGCTPTLEYRRGEALAADGCCCGNHFAVGPAAGANLAPGPGFRLEVQTFSAPWGERLDAAWLVGPSTHEPQDHDHDHPEGLAHVHDAGQTQPGKAIDPVCGMTVDPDSARASGLHSSYQGTDYFFCGKGCRLDFDEDPERYLDPGHVPSM